MSRGATPRVYAAGPIKHAGEVSRTRPEVEALDATLANIPDELTTYCGWVCWRYEQRTGEHKPTKVPYDPRVGRRASHSDSRTWRTFEEAVTACGNGGYDGIGFVFSSGDPFTGIDLDGCRKPETGELEEWAERVIVGLGGYAEASPSGGGVHVIIRGRLPEGVKHKVEGSAGGTIEAYSERRFFTMTGRVLG